MTADEGYRICARVSDVQEQVLIDLTQILPDEVRDAQPICTRCALLDPEIGPLMLRELPVAARARERGETHVFRSDEE